MKKAFNTTGVCHPKRHYMMETTQKVVAVMNLIEQGNYFTINRPRQFGKTTLLQSLTTALQQKGYIALRLSLQGVDEKWHQSDKAFAQLVMNLVVDRLTFFYPDLTDALTVMQQTIVDMNTLSKAITQMMHQLDKEIVLLIDEVDASSNYLPFLSFLAMLRTKYLDRWEPYHATFHSVVLAGVHDIKNLKYKKAHADKAEYNSPWNIAVDFKVRMRFIPSEITPMLTDYSHLEGVAMDVQAIADRLYFHTSGYPFLISKLCKLIVEDVLPTKTTKEWTLDNVEAAVQLLLRENNTNFDSLIKNLENNPDLYDLVYRLMILGDTIPFNQYNNTIAKGVLYGVFKKNGQLKIHNRIYEQLIYDYMTSMTLTKMDSNYIYGEHFRLPNHQLDMQAVLLQFQQFMKEQFSEKQKGFIEHHGRLLFLSFLAPILNGQGYTFKEVQTSLEKRLDVVVTFFQHRYIIELKRWYGPKAHQAGLDQLADYLDIHGMDEGFLLIFDDRKSKTWAKKTIPHQGKTIFAVWV